MGKRKKCLIAPVEEDHQCDRKPRLDATWHGTFKSEDRRDGKTRIIASNDGRILIEAHGPYYTMGYGPLTGTVEEVECLIEHLQAAIVQVKVWANTGQLEGHS